MANLIQLSDIETNSQIGREAAALLLQHSPLLKFLNDHSAFELDAVDFDWYPADIDSNLDARARGGEYTAEDVAPGSRETGSQYFMGDAVHIDEADLRDWELGLRDKDSHLYKKLQRRLRHFARAYDVKMFNGSGETNILKGLVKYFDGSTDIPGWPSGEKGVINAGSVDPADGDSYDLTSIDNYEDFTENLMKWAGEVEGEKYIWVNNATHARLTTIARNLHLLGSTVDKFGVPITTFAGIPFVKMLDGSLPNTEDDDAGTPVETTTSIWVVAPGEQRFSFVTNSGLAWKDYDPADKQSEGFTWEIRGAWKFEDQYAARRIRNIKVLSA